MDLRERTYSRQTLSLAFSSSDKALVPPGQQAIRVPPFHLWRVAPLAGFAGLPVELQVNGVTQVVTDLGWQRYGPLETFEDVAIQTPSTQPAGLAGASGPVTGAVPFGTWLLIPKPVDSPDEVTSAVAPRLLWEGTAPIAWALNQAGFFIPAGQPGLWVETDNPALSYELLQSDTINGVVIAASCGTLAAAVTAGSGSSGVIPCGGRPFVSFGWLVASLAGAHVKVYAP